MRERITTVATATKTLPSLESGVESGANDLTESQFKRVSELIYQLSGIKLEAGKEGLVKARLAKRLRTLGFTNFDQYFDHVEGDSTGRELVTMIDALATNKTSFFREAQHFDFLRAQVLPLLMESKRAVRFWSAGCSSGEEPYSMAILLAENLRDIRQRNIKILATDISTRILAVANEAIYTQEVVRDIPPGMLQKYFTVVQAGPPRLYQVVDSLKAMVRLARLNLMEPWPMSGPFDAIFCRNVMIYFDRPTRERLVSRFWNLLPDGGYLFVGHSESLTGLSTKFRYVQPAVYGR